MYGSEGTGFIVRPRFLINNDYSLIMEDKPVDSLCHSGSGQPWHFLGANIVERLITGVGVLATGDGPNAVACFD
jgi:hypothetical protein